MWQIRQDTNYMLFFCQRAAEEVHLIFPFNNQRKNKQSKNKKICEAIRTLKKMCGVMMGKMMILY
jgi:hypothetical protein